MNEKIERVLIDEKTLKARIAEMGAEISRDYAGEELVVIGLLKGGRLFPDGIDPAYHCAGADRFHQSLFLWFRHQILRQGGYRL